MTGQEFLGLVMLIVMIGAIFIGFPISFTMLFLAFVFGYLGLGEVVFELAYFQTMFGLTGIPGLGEPPLALYVWYGEAVSRWVPPVSPVASAISFTAQSTTFWSTTS